MPSYALKRAEVSSEYTGIGLGTAPRAAIGLGTDERIPGCACPDDARSFISVHNKLWVGTATKFVQINA